MTVSRRHLLTKEEATALKRDIWAGGKKQWDIAKSFNLSQGTISRVISGEAYPDIPWPDSSKGPMSPERHRSLMLLRAGRDASTRRPVLPPAPPPSGATLQRLTPERVEKFKDLDQKISEEMEEDFALSISKVGPNPEDSPPPVMEGGIDELRQDILPWSDCIERLGVGHNLIVKASRMPSTEGDLLKQAIGITILNVNEKDKHFERAVLSVLSDLEEES